MEEVDEFKVITEQERFREKKKIIEKHRHIEDSLQSKQLQKNHLFSQKGIARYAAESLGG